MAAKRKVLLVDDDADFVTMNKVVLEKNGYEVIPAYNGRECLEQVKATSPDLIILDIMMSTVSDGMFVAQDLRREQPTKEIPIIVVTSVNQVPPYNIGPDQGWLPVDVFIEKPVAPDVLLEQVDKMLARPS